MSRRYSVYNEPNNISPDLAALIDQPVRLISFGQYIENHKKQHKNCQCVTNNSLYETEYKRGERYIFDSTKKPWNLMRHYDSNSKQDSINLIKRIRREKEEVKNENSNIDAKQQIRHGMETDDGRGKEYVYSKKDYVETTYDNVVPKEKVSSSQTNKTKNFDGISYQTEFYNKICNTIEDTTNKSEKFPNKNNRKSRPKRSLSQSSGVEKSNKKKESPKVTPQSYNLEVVKKSNAKNENQIYKNVAKSIKQRCSTDNKINKFFGYPNNNRKDEGMSVSNMDPKSKKIAKPNEINSKYTDPKTDVKYSFLNYGRKVI